MIHCPSCGSKLSEIMLGEYGMPISVECLECGIKADIRIVGITPPSMYPFKNPPPSYAGSGKSYNFYIPASLPEHMKNPLLELTDQYKPGMLTTMDALATTDALQFWQSGLKMIVQPDEKHMEFTKQDIMSLPDAVEPEIDCAILASLREYDQSEEREI